MSTLIPVLTVCGAIMVAFELYSFYGVALAGVGMLSTLGITLATDAYGPVADNAGGIAEQAHLAPEVRQRTDALDALGNTTAATGKGFAIGSATLTALALMATYAIAANLFEGGDENSLLLNLLDHRTLVGLLIGGLLPFIFSALTMQGRGPRGILHRAGGSPPVPGDTRNHDGGASARLHPLRGHQHPAARCWR